jgi:hypothetical protein
MCFLEQAESKGSKTPTKVVEDDAKMDVDEEEADEPANDDDDDVDDKGLEESAAEDDDDEEENEAPADEAEVEDDEAAEMDVDAAGAANDGDDDSGDDGDDAVGGPSGDTQEPTRASLSSPGALLWEDPKKKKARLKKEASDRKKAEVKAAKDAARAEALAAKGPVAPKPPLGALKLFCNDKRAEVKQANEGATIKEVNALLETQWNELADEDKATYEAKADELMQAFLAENPDYKSPEPKTPKARNASASSAEVSVCGGGGGGGGGGGVLVSQWRSCLGSPVAFAGFSATIL